MPSESVVNLIGVFSPLCLMKIKRLLLGLKTGESIHILIQDSEVIDDLIKIIDHSPDEIVGMQKEKNHFKISIQKGLRANIHL